MELFLDTINPTLMISIVGIVFLINLLAISFLKHKKAKTWMFLLPLVLLFFGYGLFSLYVLRNNECFPSIILAPFLILMFYFTNYWLVKLFKLEVFTSIVISFSLFTGVFVAMFFFPDFFSFFCKSF